MNRLCRKEKRFSSQQSQSQSSSSSSFSSVVGDAVGASVGDAVGASVGDAVGASVGQMQPIYASETGIVPGIEYSELASQDTISFSFVGSVVTSMPNSKLSPVNE